jgi:hypothetical protein
MLRLLVTANVVPSSQSLVSLRMEAIRSSETSTHTRATRRSISEDGTFQFWMNFAVELAVSYDIKFIWRYIAIIGKTKLALTLSVHKPCTQNYNKCKKQLLVWNFWTE